MKQRDQFVFVLGPHRSGSSLTAGALHSLGVNLGSRFIEPNDDNPKGFFEDANIVRLNDRLLRSMNLSWDGIGFIWEEDFTSPRCIPYKRAAIEMLRERFSNTRVCGLKDPRFCILLPFWTRVVAEALDVDVSYVLSIRDPVECVKSQKVRHIRDSDFHLLGRRNIHTLLLWWTYLYKALRTVDPDRLIVVAYSTLVDSPRSEIQRLASFIGIDPSRQEIDSFCTDFVTPLLNRSKLQPESRITSSGSHWELADSLYARLLALSRRAAVRSEDIAEALAGPTIQELHLLYLQEVQKLYGYSYKKILSLRHRLILSIQETGDERDKFNEMRAKHEAMRGEYELLNAKYDALNTEYESLSAYQQLILNSRGWRLLSFLRRFITWPFR